MARTNTNTGGGGSGNPAAPNNSFQYNNGGVFGGDALATRDPLTKYSKITRQYNSTVDQYTLTVGQIVLAGPFTGTFIVGENFTDNTTGATGKIEAFILGMDFNVLTISNLVGTINNTDALEGDTSGATCQAGDLLTYPSFIVGDTFIAFDPATGLGTGAGTVTAVSGITYTVSIQSGTIPANTILLDDPESPNKFAGVITSVLAPVVVTLTTGFYTNNAVLGGTSQGSALSLTDGDNTVITGVFDASGIGGQPFTGGALFSGVDGSLSALTVAPGTASIFTSDGANNSASVYALTTEAALNVSPDGEPEVGVRARSGQLDFFTGDGYIIRLPFSASTPASGESLTISSVVGNQVFTDWINGGGGGGSSSSPEFSIQMSDGLGGFESSPNFLWNYGTDTPTFSGSNGIFTASQVHKLGNFQATDASAGYFYLEGNPGSQTNIMDYFSAAETLGNIVAGMGNTGPNNLGYFSTAYNGTGQTNYSVTIDSVGPIQSGSFHTGSGLNDGTISAAIYSGTYFPSVNYTVTIDTTPNYNGVDFFGSGLDDLTNPVPSSFNGSSNRQYRITIGSLNNMLLNTDNPVGGVFGLGETITGSISGTVATITLIGGNAIYYKVTAGTDFIVGDVIDNGSGTTANVTSIAGLTFDLVTWTDGITNGTFGILATGFDFPLSNGVNVQFANMAGHTLFEYWEFQYFYFNYLGTSYGGGGGLDDLTTTTPYQYTGIVPGNVIVNITGINGGQLDYNTLVGTINIGDTMTGPSGSGVVVQITGSFVKLKTITGAFMPGDALSFSGGATALAGAFSGVIGDVYSYTDAGGTNDGYLCSTFPSIIGDNLTIVFGSALGHSLSDFWDIAYSALSDTFSWSIDGAVQATGVAITGSPQSLSNGVEMQFGSTSGHAIGDRWNTYFGQGGIRYYGSYLTPSWVEGETVLGTLSAATAKVYYVSTYAGSYMHFAEISGIFRQGETVIGQTSGNTWQLLDFNNFVDTVTITNSHLADVKFHPIGAGLPLAVGQNVFVSFMTDNNHPFGDSWSFSVALNIDSKFRIAGSTILIGDVNNSSAHFDRFQIKLDTGESEMYVSNTYKFIDSYPGHGGRTIGKFDSINRRYSLGEIDGDTFISVSSGDKNIQISADQMALQLIQSTYQWDLGDMNGTAIHSQEGYIDIVSRLHSGGGDYTKISLKGGAYGYSFDVNRATRSMLNIDFNTAFSERITLGGTNTNDGSLLFDMAAHTSSWRTLIGQANPTGIDLSGDDRTITFLGAPINANVTIVPFNSVQGLDLDDYILSCSGGTGLITLVLNSVMPIGKVFIVKDLDCIAAANNITFDVGTGETIAGIGAGATVAQTFTLTQNGQCVTFRKVTATQWQAE